MKIHKDDESKTVSIRGMQDDVPYLCMVSGYNGTKKSGFHKQKFRFHEDKFQICLSGQWILSNDEISDFQGKCFTEVKETTMLEKLHLIKTAVENMSSQELYDRIASASVTKEEAEQCALLERILLEQPGIRS